MFHTLFSRLAKGGLTALLLVTPLLAFAQKTITVTGTVSDDTNEPVIGANVFIKGSTVGASTDLDGKYTIKVPENSTLEFSALGLKTSVEQVAGRQIINVVLRTDNTFLESVVVVGYGTQKRGSITGAIAGIGSDELVKTKTENPQNMLTGRVPGLRVWQKSSEPGTYSSNIDIRGFGSVLVVIDGVPRSIDDFNRLNASDIENVSVLKDAAAAIYGVRGGGGVILVSTKKGTEGKATVKYNGSFTMQTPSGLPTLASATDAMVIYNEMAYNNINGGSAIFSDEFIQEYLDGTRTATDWNDLVIQNFAPQTQHDISISGGDDKYKYYVSMGYIYQEGFFKSGDLNYDKYNVRANLDAAIVNGLNLNINLAANVDEQNKPLTESDWIIRNWWRQGLLYPAYADAEGKMLSYKGMDLDENTIAEMTADVSGFRQFSKKQVQSSATLSYDFGKAFPVLEGLKGNAMYSYDFRYDTNTIFRKEYNLYEDDGNGGYNMKVYGGSTPSQLQKTNFQSTQNLYQLTLSYDHAFGRHSVSALVGYEDQIYNSESTNVLGSLLFSNPYFSSISGDKESYGIGGNYSDVEHKAAFGRLNYNYDERYLVEGQIRRDGSSYFAPGHQWGIFPSVSAGWRISQEPWFRNLGIFSFVNQLKVRASYGVMGDDRGPSDYAWMTGYTYRGGETSTNGWYNGYVPGYLFDDKFISTIDPQPLPNVNYTWYKTKTFNIGGDFEGWDGLLGISVDYFKRHRTGLLTQDTSNLPTVVGASAPVINGESDYNFGLEVEIKHRNTIGEVAYNVTGMVTITRQKYGVSLRNGNYGNSYDKWRHDNLNNRYQGIQFGYEGAGRFTSWEDIWAYGQNIYTERTTLPGDYKYEDWNGDGEINGLDEHPYAYDQTPWMNYSLSLDASWRNLDFSILFQGSALGSMEYVEPLHQVWGVQQSAGGVLTQYLDRWHPVNDGWTDPYDQSLTWTSGYYALPGHWSLSNSSFNRVSTDFLRLKSVEIGYTLPKIDALRTMSLRVYANAYNPLTLTKLKFVDPEHPSDSYGRMYPLNKTYTLGVNLTF
ncbi:MAG: TonB-dependent receptor [Bacteroidales bacterium]|nr:TonB-dependent receptor [Bacteroidales bacterium]